jgi:heme oxygenase
MPENTYSQEKGIKRKMDESALRKFPAYVNDMWRNIESNIRLFADDCIIYRKINNTSDIDKLQKDLNKLGEWALENEMKMNPGKSKAVSFTRLG